MTASAHEKIALQVIDAWLGYRFRHSGLPGAQLCVRKKGEIVFSQAYGQADMRRRIKMEKDHLFRIASHSKMLTACALFTLERQGKLRLSQKVCEFIPALKKHRDKRFKKITLEHLLSNRSGLFRDGFDGGFWDLTRPFLTQKQILHEVTAAELVYAPGTVTKYSNMGFALLGMVVEAASGRPYVDFLQQEVLAKIPAAGLSPDLPRGAKIAMGHSGAFYKGRRHALKHAPAKALAAAGGFCGNAESISLFLHEYIKGRRLLSAAQKSRLAKRHWRVMNSKTERYGLGLQLDVSGGLTLTGHSGGYPGFSSQTRHIKGTDCIVSFLINSNDRITLEVVFSVARILENIQKHFATAELESAVVSPPLMNKWGSSICVIAKNKALYLDAETWALGANPILLKRRGSAYVSDAMNGFASAGEPVRFTGNQGGKVKSMRFGAYLSLNEKDFLKASRKTFAR